MRFLGLCLLWIYVGCEEFKQGVNVGERCRHEDLIGTCKKYSDCQFAKDLVNFDGRDYTACSKEPEYTVVCCPDDDDEDVITVSRLNLPLFEKKMDYLDMLSPLNNVVSHNIFCRNYTSQRQVHMVCHRDLRLPLLYQEPSECPPITLTEQVQELPAHHQVLLEACQNYTKVGHKCLRSANDPDSYYRTGCDDHMQTPYIAGGTPAEIKKFPHLAVLGTRDTSQHSIYWFGGGALISEYFILTATHVLLSTGGLRFAMLGATKTTDIRSGVLFGVVRVIAYPGYDHITKKHDLALVQLNKRVTFTEYIRPACLQVPGLKLMTTNQVAGWGTNQLSRGMSDNLRMATIYTVDSSECRKKLSSKTWNGNLTICAGWPDKSISTSPEAYPDTCQGDSGTPYVTRIEDANCMFVILGVVSWGTRCGVGEPASYTNLSYGPYLKWIAENVWLDIVREKSDK